MIYATYIASIVTLCCAVYLIDERQYEDGVLGRIALAGLILASVAALLGGLEDYPAPAQLAWWSFALFMARHTYRFRRYRLTGAGEWSRSARAG